MLAGNPLSQLRVNLLVLLAHGALITQQNWATRAARQLRIGNCVGPPRFAPVMLFGRHSISFACPRIAFVYGSLKQLVPQCLVKLVEALATTGCEQRRRAKNDNGDVSSRLVEREGVVAWRPLAVPEEPGSVLTSSMAPAGTMVRPSGTIVRRKRNDFAETGR
jgi:hypothetical protein